MGMFAFRRLRELEAASNEAASLSIAEPAPKLDLTGGACRWQSTINASGRARKTQTPT
jgi:hypothetical protein